MCVCPREPRRGRGMAGSMQAADAAGRISALLSLLALRRILAVLQPLLLLLLLPFRWRARQGDAALADAVAASVTASSGKKAKAAVVLRVPAGSPMVCSRRQALVRREAAMRRPREAGRDYELIPTACGETLFTQSWCPHASSSIKPRALVVVMHGLNEHISEFGSLLVCFYCWLVWPVADDWVLPWIDLAVAWTWTGLAMVAVMVYMDTCNLLIMLSKT